MKDQIPLEVREAIRAELDADDEEYRNTVPEGEWTRPNRGRSPLLTLRTSEETLEELQKVAAASGTSVSALARRFIADGLASYDGDNLHSALERLERDLIAVKAHASAR